MIFLTRDLFDGYQPNSGRERQALREWRRRSAIYSQYLEVIAPMLPRPVVRLCREGLHDAVILAASRRGDELVMAINTTNALTGFRGSAVCLTFRGVRGRPPVTRLVGEWWLYEEAHLSARSGFALHVLFNRTELVIEADELTIAVSRPPRPNGRAVTGP
jgi:hypothetical protein